MQEHHWYSWCNWRFIHTHTHTRARTDTLVHVHRKRNNSTFFQSRWQICLLHQTLFDYERSHPNGNPSNSSYDDDATTTLPAPPPPAAATTTTPTRTKITTNREPSGMKTKINNVETEKTIQLIFHLFNELHQSSVTHSKTSIANKWAKQIVPFVYYFDFFSIRWFVHSPRSLGSLHSLSFRLFSFFTFFGFSFFLLSFLSILDFTLSAALRNTTATNEYKNRFLSAKFFAVCRLDPLSINNTFIQLMNFSRKKDKKKNKTEIMFISSIIILIFAVLIIYCCCCCCCCCWRRRRRQRRCCDAVQLWWMRQTRCEYEFKSTINDNAQIFVSWNTANCTTNNSALTEQLTDYWFNFILMLGNPWVEWYNTENGDDGRVRERVRKYYGWWGKCDRAILHLVIIINYRNMSPKCA